MKRHHELSATALSIFLAFIAVTPAVADEPIKSEPDFKLHKIKDNLIKKPSLSRNLNQTGKIPCVNDDCNGIQTSRYVQGSFGTWPGRYYELDGSIADHPYEDEFRYMPVPGGNSPLVALHDVKFSEIVMSDPGYYNCL